MPVQPAFYLIQPKLPSSRFLFRLGGYCLLGLAIFAFSRANSEQAVYAVPNYQSLKPTHVIPSQPEKILGVKFVVVE